MTKIDENYIDIKPQTNMLILEGWRAYRHNRLFIEVYNTFWHKFGCNTHLLYPRYEVYRGYIVFAFSVIIPPVRSI